METTLPTQVTESSAAFRRSALAGLKHRPKRLECKYFYDRRGSLLFDRICQLEAYYLTRAESTIMREYAPAMGAALGQRVMLVEYGSGSSIKTRILLDHLQDPAAYVPVDISRKHLLAVAAGLKREYPQLELLPIAADFTKPFELPVPTREPASTAVYFPGSTIGNFVPAAALELLKSVAERCGEGGSLLIGIDLVKDPRVLELAYDDPAGVTAEFNLNLLHRLRNELDAEIDLDGFEHVAYYNPRLARVEIYIRSLCEQVILLDGEVIRCGEGELIHTEYSHKYTVAGFARQAAEAGLALKQYWTDHRQYFAVLLFTVGK